jgi:integrase
MMMTVCTWLKKNPLHSVSGLLEQDDWPDYEESDPLPYSEDDIAKMLAVATPEESFIVRFGIGTGSRDAEARFLEKSDIDFKRGTWWVHAKTVTVRGKRGMRTDKWSPKTTAGTRYIPLSDDLLAEIRVRPDGLVFRGPRGGYNHKFTVIVADLAERAGLDPDVPHYFHRLRDTFGTLSCARRFRTG